ncbi:MAG: FAD-dependent oxidoreductase, partial [Spirochaetes bacterium]|nr:FAD-dependent oxidoreductase [Spirochaetota bacterium]
MKKTTAKQHDVVIFGAGPAGLSAALHLAKKGICPLVIEKNPIGKTKKTWLLFKHIIDEYGLKD